MFKGEGSLVDGNDREQLEESIVEYHDIFARQRLNVVINDNFKVKLSAKDEPLVNTESPPIPNNLQADLTVELALMHRYGIITASMVSNYANWIFAHRNSNGKMRLHVDLRKINALILDDCINNIDPASNLSDAAHHLAGKKLFWIMDFPEAYHFLPIKDQLKS